LAGVFCVLPRRFFAVVLAVIGSLALVLFTAGPAQTEPMTASWYGPGFGGRTTASGEPFDPSGYTVASMSLPFGTKLIVTYEGRSVVVRVNDRGPFSKADLDLSQGAAQYLGMIQDGVATVDVVAADPNTPIGPYKVSPTSPSDSGTQYNDSNMHFSLPCGVSLFRQEQEELVQFGYPTPVSGRARECESLGWVNPYPAPFMLDSEGFVYAYDPIEGQYYYFDPNTDLYYILEPNTGEVYTYDPVSGTYL
jgi:hypothetical protein